MCLTIPKKVLRKKGNNYVVEKSDGKKQEVKSIIKINIGDYVVTQSNVIIQKLSKKQAQEINDLLNQ
ncbi:MAG TPA: HypC/HybG/HupF family hydrogenase formation chaperone [Patescibacteria group bacterium]